MKMKRVILITACLMVLVLGISMICVGCKKENDTTPVWTPGNNQSADGTTGTEGTAGMEGTAPNAPSQGGSSTDETKDGNIDIVEREEFPDTTETDPTKATNPTNPVSPTNPTNPQPGNTAPAYPTLITYEQYMAMTGEEQMAYYRTFPSMQEFNKWYNNAKAEYDRAHPKETIGPDGKIELG